MLLRYCLNGFEFIIIIIIINIIISLCLHSLARYFFQEPWPNLEAADVDNCHYLSILRKIILNQQGTMLNFVVYVRCIVSLVPIVFQTCSVVLEMKSAAWQTKVSAVPILFYAFFKKKHKKEIFGERVELSRLKISTSQNSTTFMISELYKHLSACRPTKRWFGFKLLHPA